MKQISYSRDAIKTLSKLPNNASTKIRSRIRQYASDPASQANNVKRLQGSEFYRLRVGDWRVIFKEDLEIVAVIKIGSRGDVYR